MRKTTNDALPAIQQALALHGQGRLREAELLYERVLQSDSRHFDALHRLGLIRLQQNRFADAEVLFRRAVKIEKKSVDARHHLAIALTGMRQFSEAVPHYGKVLEARPRDVTSHNNLGYVLQKLDRHEEASRHFQRALSIDPAYPEAHNNLGNALQSLGRTEAAIDHYRQALKLRPNYTEAHSNLASALAVCNRHEEAIASCKSALALAPNNAEAHMNLANSLGATERLQEALTHYQNAIAIDPANAEARARAAFMLFQLGRIQEAIAQCEKALAIEPAHAAALNNLGVALRALGRTDEAIGCFEKAITAAPKDAGGLYCILAGSKRMSASDPHFAAMQRLTGDMASLSTDNQIGLHFALGKALVDIGEHQRAFEHLVKGNALKRREFVEYDESRFLTRFERIQATLTPALLTEKKFLGDPSSQPVFIIGMPRSGTSLVEQILASHPQVFGAGERYEFSDLAHRIKSSDDAEFPEAVAAMPDDALRALGANYVSAIRPLAPEAARITDKMPTNFFFTGLIHLALPNARIIHIRRDPRDIAMSCFSILFAVGHPHTYDLAELGRYIRAYERLMEHWRRVLPKGAMFEVQYEHLVGNLEAEAKRIVEYCGLEWDDACLLFHKTIRPVRTASVIQVRQPIYGSSVGRWRVYENELQPFLRALEGA
ncbi:MAG TPA: tetratricopeptide repeat protein [Candidatus Binataceae bacterium]|nr:tetratricopeptide repeat protein [Candidatus Binataceae bacterium]